MERKIAVTLMLGQKLSEDQKLYVKNEIEPQYEDKCHVCVVNTLLSLGVEPSEAFEAAAKCTGKHKTLAIPTQG